MPSLEQCDIGQVRTSLSITLPIYKQIHSLRYRWTAFWISFSAKQVKWHHFVVNIKWSSIQSAFYRNWDLKSMVDVAQFFQIKPCRLQYPHIGSGSTPLTSSSSRNYQLLSIFEPQVFIIITVKPWYMWIGWWCSVYIHYLIKHSTHDVFTMSRLVEWGKPLLLFQRCANSVVRLDSLPQVTQPMDLGFKHLPGSKPVFFTPVTYCFLVPDHSIDQ
jgi:hypothetical protein